MDQKRAAPPYPSSVAVQKYDRLQQRRRLRALLRLLSQTPTAALLSFDQVQQLLRNRMETDRGTQMIRLDDIVGSVGRYRDFDRAFLPLRGANRERWAQLDVALNEMRPWPPIEVYKVGEVYFVRDGNHRVSVARANGLTHIEAHVTEVEPRVPLTPDIKVDDLILKADYAAFLRQTHLDETRPGHDIRLTEPGRYQQLLEHIEVHRYYMGIEQQHDVSLADAAAHWYDTVYLPTVQAIRATKVLKEFPKRTEADLYLWVAYHRERLHMPPDEEVAHQLAQKFSERPVIRVVRMMARIARAALKAAFEKPQPPAPR